MNIFDFDKTIYKGDSTLDFYFFCLLRHPKILLCLPKQLWGYFLYILGRIDKTQFKATFFCFLQRLSKTNGKTSDRTDGPKCVKANAIAAHDPAKIQKLVEAFWQKNSHKIQQWYFDKHQNDDVVISASPEFLLQPICRKLHITHLIASQVDPCTGNFTGLNCYGEEKVRRLETFLLNNVDFANHTASHVVEKFYSDSLSDAPLAALAKCAYIVQGDQIIPWQDYQPSFSHKIWNLLFDKRFILFLFIGAINTFNGIAFAYLFSLFTYTNLAFILGYITSLTISYFLNSLITFKSSFSLQKYVKFCISYIPNFLLQNAIVMLFYNVLGWPKLITFALAAIFGVPITFILMKVYAFRL